VRLLKEANSLAREYYSLGGKPLGVTGEVAEYEAAREFLVLNSLQRGRLDMTRLSALTARQRSCKSKGVVYRKTVNRESDWNAVLMVLLDHEFNALENYEAERPEIVSTLKKPGSIARACEVR
jgi:hypothetical protein